ncbi:MAG: polyprenyl diphosphate synthase [Termitinemataceae bacterium]|nr:MAG: polyprenyl diphosphate synthase [Termitinemataceae bacterium]
MHQNAGKIPLHVGVIMDGNGRYAQMRGLPRTAGHLEGLKAARRIVQAASDFGIRYLTLYVFSTENFKRPKSEVDFIMDLVKKHLMREIDFYKENKIRIRHCGDTSSLSPQIIDELDKAQSDTKKFDGMQVVLALNYGGRREIVRALQRITEQNIAADKISEEMISSALDNPDIPDPDLIIRSAGEYRLSNFLLWQSAYSELYISDQLWPDFNEDSLKSALENFGSRTRRFGAVVK